jgi:hypothetical protein
MSEILEFTGTLTPDSTGDFYEIGIFNGEPYYYNSVKEHFHFWNIYTSQWVVCAELGSMGQYHWFSEDKISQYAPGGEALGIGDMHTKSISGNYHIYRGQDGHIDYEDLQAGMSLDAESVTIPYQDLPPGTRWDYIRRQVSECGLESEDSPLCKVRIDEIGDMYPLCPNPPQDVICEPAAGGEFKLRWRYNATEEEITPSGFKIYLTEGEWVLLDTISSVPGGNGEYEWTSNEEFDDGERCHFCVRSYAEGAGESQNTNIVSGTADATGPPVITGLESSVEYI